MPSFGAVEAGGTKFVCAVGTGPEDLRARMEYPTTSPEETLGRVVGFFGEQAKRDSLAAVGIASFGPLDLNPVSPHFGFITTTPKAGWRDVDLAGPIRRALKLPVAFDTDVNAAALGEHRWGAAQGIATFVYVTVGTGIGGGGMVEIRPHRQASDGRRGLSGPGRDGRARGLRQLAGDPPGLHPPG